jgi:hypothetical protein
MVVEASDEDQRGGDWGDPRGQSMEDDHLVVPINAPNVLYTTHAHTTHCSWLFPPDIYCCYMQGVPFLQGNIKSHTNCKMEVETVHYITHATVAGVKRYKVEYYRLAKLFYVVQDLNPYIQHITII